MPMILTIVRHRAGVARRWFAVAAIAAAALAGSRPAAAQGNLSTHGLGYPPGQFSTRTYGAGGAMAEVDPNSPINPAALIDFGTTTLFFQIEPEYRTVTTPNAVERTTTARYPLLLAAFPMGQRWMVGLSASTFLDATWMTTAPTNQVVGADTIGGTIMNRVDGAINDLSAALAFSPTPWLRLGAAGHVYSGSHRDSVERVFPDSAVFATFGEQRTVSYTGGALSAGAELVVPRQVIFAASYRYGGTLRQSAGDTALGHARIPDRFGASVAYIGILGTTIAARTALDKWSALGTLGGERGSDTWDSSVGADIAGPRFADRALMLRAGARWRTLPFSAEGHNVTERSLTGGLGTLLANGRASVDLAAIHAVRDAGVGIGERAWILSIGLTVRP